MCSRCAELDTTVTIDGPASLVQVLKVIRDNLADGTLKPSTYWPPGQIALDLPPFGELAIDGPWPDYLEYYFACATCDRVYRLAVDTFHGRGGSWKPLG